MYHNRYQLILAVTMCKKFLCRFRGVVIECQIPIQSLSKGDKVYSLPCTLFRAVHICYVSPFIFLNEQIIVKIDVMFQVGILVA